MKTATVFLLLLCFGTILPAQGKWSIGGEFSPSISRNIVTFQGVRQGFIFPAFSYGVNGVVEFALSDRFRLQSGLGIDHWRLTEKINNPGFDPAFLRIEYSRVSLKLPVSFQWMMTRGNLRIFSRAGLNLIYSVVGYFNGYTRNDENENWEKNNHVSYVPADYAANPLLIAEAGAGVHWQMNERNAFRVNPFFAYQFTNYFGNVPGNLTGYHWRAGLNFQVLFNL